MKHFHIELERNGQLTRSWELWSEHLKVGSALENDIVLPPPYAALVAECETAPYGLEIPLGTEKLRIIEDTDLHRVRWASARERMELSRKMGWREPGQGQSRSRTLGMGIMGILSLAAMVGLVMVGKTPRETTTTDIQAVIELVAQPEEKKEETPKPKEEVPQEQAAVSKEKPTPEPVGGATENQTVFKERVVAARSVMENSILDRIDTKSDGAFGELVDASAENVVDAIIAGGAGHLQKGVGGHGVSGNGDRMGEQSGMGFGYGGPAGVGAGVASSRQGNKPTMGSGRGNNKIATRAKEILTRPQDVDIGGDAGSRSPESILRVIREHVGGFRYTYEKFLKQNPGIGGKISLKFTIGPSGDIVAIEIAGSNTGNGTLDQEIKDKARRMKFESIEKGNVTVTYAFVLDKQ